MRAPRRASAHSPPPFVASSSSHRRAPGCSKLAPGGDLATKASPALKAPAVVVRGAEGARRGRPSAIAFGPITSHSAKFLHSTCTQARPGWPQQDAWNPKP
eukprot:scaffold2401_cov67-Phaeocystis_antarctica.AAC.10